MRTTREKRSDGAGTVRRRHHQNTDLPQAALPHFRGDVPGVIHLDSLVIPTVGPVRPRLRFPSGRLLFILALLVLSGAPSFLATGCTEPGIVSARGDTSTDPIDQQDLLDEQPADTSDWEDTAADDVPSDEPDESLPSDLAPQDFEEGGESSDGVPDGERFRDILIVDVSFSDSPTDSVIEICPSDMVYVEDFCIDRYEAPNREGASPLVMASFYDGSAWCALQGKRLCYDDEWTRACGGPENYSYPYGDTHISGVCNDDETWRLYDQDLLNGWPPAASAASVESFEQQLQIARDLGRTAAANHVEWLYQAEPSGSNTGCRGDEGVFDLCGNVEEWTRRRDGGSGPEFLGSLKGRYWAETRTCQSGVTSHGNAFRFYEIGFRCCMDTN